MNRKPARPFNIVKTGRTLFSVNNVSLGNSLGQFPAPRLAKYLSAIGRSYMVLRPADEEQKSKIVVKITTVTGHGSCDSTRDHIAYPPTSHWDMGSTQLNPYELRRVAWTWPLLPRGSPVRNAGFYELISIRQQDAWEGNKDSCKMTDVATAVLSLAILGRS
ncbi:uncharacterized protein MYCFIDRAFT_173477 [Pseudocercospora fijiensis CIRAD86]|uniref:Uncharacterized protein n=1 Tax=Pseudocercospora fijiensis (strain CIRAD86) TaxID=383855 RepID=M3B551_PSEFD|nr:uncharacterized protein MYCFIDRAFT_173477 [Pseudocercospora fijiensis CIRAD86]EME84498.1 hypothetical protein MYCFIDRAFT_173477 [Pseudocercospora fijiensis CIRAD86]